jgi:hypothetical protein
MPTPVPSVLCLLSSETLSVKLGPQAANRGGRAAQISIDLNMKKPLHTAARSLILLLLCVTAPGAAVQQPSAVSFPEKLLEGAPDFNLAFMIHGDLRGSYGPCG